MNACTAQWCTHTHAHTCTQHNTHEHMHAHARARAHAHTHTHTQRNTNLILIRTDANTCTHTNTHMHAHAPAGHAARLGLQLHANHRPHAAPIPPRRAPRPAAAVPPHTPRLALLLLLLLQQLRSGLRAWSPRYCYSGGRRRSHSGRGACPAACAAVNALAPLSRLPQLLLLLLLPLRRLPLRLLLVHVKGACEAAAAGHAIHGICAGGQVRGVSHLEGRPCMRPAV